MEEYPEEDLCGYIGRVKYVEPDRYVVEVNYGASKPPKVRFFAVSKEGDKVCQVQDSKYTPTYKK